MINNHSNHLQVRQEFLEQNGRVFGVSASNDDLGMYNRQCMEPGIMSITT